jgi:hypothetical protein
LNAQSRNRFEEKSSFSFLKDSVTSKLGEIEKTMNCFVGIKCYEKYFISFGRPKVG